jgi:hypothetical protein
MPPLTSAELRHGAQINKADRVGHVLGDGV